MESSIKNRRLRVGGMSCVGCQNKIEKKLRSTAGIKSVKASYGAGTVDITYDTDLIALRDIYAVIEKLDYTVLAGSERLGPGWRDVAGTLGIIVFLYVLLQQFGILNLLVPSRLADSGTGYGMLFVIGLLTSVHCVAMCGGINLSQCIPQSVKSETVPAGKKQPLTILPALLYNLGRVLSYTAIGFLLGLAGFLLGGGSDAGLPVRIQGLLKLAAGIFMVVMGINLLGLFPGMRRLQPRFHGLRAGKTDTVRTGKRGPLTVGLLNGLMPCGPLQSMQVVALASGNPLTGALSMLMFSLGTVPLMLGLGSLVSALGKKFAGQMMRIGAILVVVLGLAMLSQGGSLSGLLTPRRLLVTVLGLCAVGIASSIPYPRPAFRKAATAIAAAAAVSAVIFWGSARGADASTAEGGSVRVVDGVQVVASTLASGSYPDITVQAGTPVAWTITAPAGSVNGCNYKMILQQFGISGYALQTGENVIDFTPEESGTYSYTCWMGMIRGTITVTAASDAAKAD